MRHSFVPAILMLSLLFCPTAKGAPPQLGQKAPRFTLTSLAGDRVTLPPERGVGDIALIVLRGFPGYQCPLCNRQVQDFLKYSQAFRDSNVRVVMVYPGPADGLDGKAKEFLADKRLPPGFELLLDPEYSFTNLYGLRWNAPRETAYPSTFLLNSKGEIYFRKISDSHGGRTTAAEVLEAVRNRSEMN